MAGNGRGLNRMFYLTERHATMADFVHGFFALIAGDGWRFSMELGNIFSAGIVIILLMVVSKNVVHIVL